MIGLLMVLGAAGALWVRSADIVTASGSPPAIPVEPVAPIDAASVPTGGTVRLTNWRCDGGSVGSAFATSAGLITAAHVVADTAGVELETGSLAPVAHLADDGVDAAVLVGDGTAPWYPIRTTVPEKGEAMAIVGYPAGGPKRVLTGQVIGTGNGAAFQQQAERVLLLSMSASEGFSGGPVLDADGRVVAVVIGVETNTGVTIAVPLADLGPMLAGVGAPQPAATC